MGYSGPAGRVLDHLVRCGVEFEVFCRPMRQVIISFLGTEPEGQWSRGFVQMPIHQDLLNPQLAVAQNVDTAEVSSSNSSAAIIIPRIEFGSRSEVHVVSTPYSNVRLPS